MKVLREQLAHDCKVDFLTAYDVPELMLTNQDIEVLHKCPLVALRLVRTSCLSPSVRDLSKLNNLTVLALMDCHNQDFVINFLPSSLKSLEIQGLRKDNIKLDIDDSSQHSKLASLRTMRVTDVSMCCPQVMTELFGSYLPEVQCKSRKARYQAIQCGLSGVTELTIALPHHVGILRHELREDCRLEAVYVYLPDFTLTQEYLNILQDCPLKRLHMYDSQCLDEYVGDLSVLENLTSLKITMCRNGNFVVHKLPNSLQELDIRGLAEYNVRLLDKDSSSFGESLNSLTVYLPAMCCKATILRMFRQDLSGVCHTITGRGCGISTFRSNKHLAIDSVHQLDDYTDELTHPCDVKQFSAAGKGLSLHQRHIDILANCPVAVLNLPYTSGFSGEVDLSNLSHLMYLMIPTRSSHLDFTITGLPATLVFLDIRGLSVKNLHLRAKDQAFGSNLKHMDVSDSAMCTCPQTSLTMFGHTLSNKTACGTSQILFFARITSVVNEFKLNNANSNIICENVKNNQL